ncbi:hypothetical protein ACFL5K_01720 [Gemmatimonadota bacterium]
MDTLAHGLWGGMTAGWRRRFGLAFLFGVCPDLLSFGALTVLRIIDGQFRPGKPALHTIPDWLYTAYDYTHSLIIIGLVWAFLWWRYRWLAVPFSAWVIHIVMDIPTHSYAFFPTPFLFPVSDFKVDGISWGQRWFMILNYSLLLAMALVFIIARERRRRGSLKTRSLEQSGQQAQLPDQQLGEASSSKSA